MTEYRKQLVDRMTKIYGFEHPLVIDFAGLCDCDEENDWDDADLTLLVRAHEACPQL